MKKFLLPAGLALLASCGTSEPAPLATGYDALALATGHWEWERTVRPGTSQSPATVGYTRQLVFTADGQVLIGHNGRVVSAASYRLDMGTLAGCGARQPNAPLITFDNEEGISAGPRKTYVLNTRSSPTRLRFEGNCTEDSAYEEFHWVNP